MSLEKYFMKVEELLSTVKNTQYDSMIEVANIFANKVKENKIIHVFGTGHSHIIGIEMFARAGGLANVNAMLDSTITTGAGAMKGGLVERLDGLADIIWDQYQMDPNDAMLIISNSGRNSVPIEMAMHAKEKGMCLIVITSLSHSKSCESRHASGKKLYEFADITIDNCVPGGDWLLDFNGVKSGPGSTLAGVTIVNSILSETLSILTNEGVDLPVFRSQNLDGTNNDDLCKKYGSRLKHI